MSFSCSGFAGTGDVMMASSEVVWGSEGRLGGEERKEFLRMPVGLELNGLKGRAYLLAVEGGRWCWLGRFGP